MGPGTTTTAPLGQSGPPVPPRSGYETAPNEPPAPPATAAGLDPGAAGGGPNAMRPATMEGGASSSTGGHAAGPPEGGPPNEGARGRRSRTPARDTPA
eukprot:3888641-Lingulodinium_polyedra.AAC.1